MNQENITDILKSKVFSIKDTGLTYRTVNNWSETGLLSHLRESEGKWHKLTIIELIEVYIYKELKELGFSIEKLKKIKNVFYDEQDNDCITDKRYLPEITIHKNEISYLQENMIALLNGQQLFLVVGSNARSAIFATNTQLMEVIAGKTDMENISELVHGNAFVVMNMKNVFKKTGLDIQLSDEKIVSIFRMLKTEHNQSEVRISKTSGEIKKVMTTTHRKLKEGESLNKLVKKPNQKTTIFSNNNGDLGIQIEEEIK